MPPNRFESEVESFLEGSHGDRTHIKRADHPRLHHYAGRYFSRTRRDNVVALKPTTPLRTPNKGPLKPASPLRPKTAPKTLISHPQRRWRFQSHTDTSEQRRRWFQTTWPSGRQGQAAVPAGPEAMSGPAISHLVSLTRTLTQWPAPGPLIPKGEMGSLEPRHAGDTPSPSS